MRNRIARAMLLLGAASCLIPAPAIASERHRFVTGNSNPQELAAKTVASIKLNPTGRSAIDPESCKHNRACGTPEDLLEMIQKSDPGAGLTSVQQLPDYIRSLEARAMPENVQYWMACKTGAGGVNDAPKWNCLTRFFHKGETAFVNPKTGAIVLARDCTNPVGKTQDEQECAELHVWMKPNDEVHIAWLGPQALPDGKCKLSIQKTGEEERSNYEMDECPRENCDFSGPSRDLGFKVWEKPRISWKAKVEGDNIIRLPVEVTNLTKYPVPINQPNGSKVTTMLSSGFVLCLVRPLENLRQTRGVFMSAVTYNQNKAFVTYEGRGLLPLGWHGVAHPWIFTDGGTK